MTSKSAPMTKPPIELPGYTRTKTPHGQSYTRNRESPPMTDTAKTEPCGGCGETDPARRCINCFHDFGAMADTETSADAAKPVAYFHKNVLKLPVAMPRPWRDDPDRYGLTPLYTAETLSTLVKERDALRAEIDKLVPFAVAYDYLEGCDRGDMAEDRAKRAEDALASSQAKLREMELALTEWHQSRSAFTGATPTGGRDALNRLSEAEDALSKVAALRTLGDTPEGLEPSKSAPMTDTETVESVVATIMEQAQLFASAWSMVGGRFAAENQLEIAEEERDGLEALVRNALSASPKGDDLEPVAWMTEDGRVVSDHTKRTAMASTSKPAFCIPLYPASRLQSLKAERETRRSRRLTRYRPKLKRWGPHGMCGCSYDTPDDLS